jgi:hypothetical protein
MKLHLRSLILIVILSVLSLSACSGKIPVTGEEAKPVQLVPITGTDLNHVVLTEKAAERLDIQTVAVNEMDVDGTKRVVVPYAALLYDSTGETWVYLNISPLTFVRQPIVVDYIDGNDVILSEGLDASAKVVTVGATELFGSESEFQEE